MHRLSQLTLSGPLAPLAPWAPWALLLLAAGACGGEPGVLDGAVPYDPGPGCNPIAAEWDCLAPYPSDFFRGPGGVEITGEAELFDVIGGEALDPFAAHRPDGFPKLPQIVAYIPGDIDDEALAFHDAPAPTLDPTTSTTVLLNAATGAAVLHFAELDPGAVEGERRALTLRPLVRLDDGTRYVVAIRGLTRVDGTPVEAPVGFRRLRDGDAPLHPALESLAARYEADVFEPLAGAGVTREELILAWDFTVSSEEDATRDLTALRRDLLARLAAAPPVVTIEERVEAPSEHVAFLIRGTLEVPLYVDADAPGARLVRDGAGVVIASGEMARVPFSLTVSPRVAARTPGGPLPRLIQYGHGFFGDRSEGEDDWLGETLDELYAVALGVDFQGMSRADFSGILADVGESPSNAFFFTDRLHQGFANFIAAAAAAQGPMVTALAEDPVTAGLYDPRRVYYYGNSNGSILGSTYVALSPHIDRAVLGVGGVGYSFMMLRAQPFASLLGLFELFIPDRLDVQLFASISQSTLDRIDPVTYAPRMLRDTYEGSPDARRVLLQYGLGDHAVPNLASELQARTLGVPILAPASRPVPELDVREGAVDGSALVQFDFGLPAPLPGTFAVPPTIENEVHDGVRRLPEAIAQMDTFFETGVVTAM